MKLCVSKRYGDRVVFDNFCLELAEGELLCVLGESGVGKTTLLNILAGQTPFEGEIEGKRERVGYVFQQPRLLPNLTVIDNLRYVCGKDREEEIAESIAALCLEPLKDKRPSALSGGEKQRVSLARAYLMGEELLLLDEPFTGLDLSRKQKAYKLFASAIKKRGAAAVLVTHDVEEAWAMGERIIVLKDGQIALDLCPAYEGEIPRPYAFGERVKAALVQALLQGEKEK